MSVPDKVAFACSICGIVAICVILAGCSPQPVNDDWITLNGSIPFDGTMQIKR